MSETGACLTLLDPASLLQATHLILPPSKNSPVHHSSRSPRPVLPVSASLLVVPPIQATRGRFDEPADQSARLVRLWQDGGREGP